MKWSGKIIGSLMGVLAAGPIGLLVGLIIGHYFDLNLIQRPFRAIDQATVQKAFFEATFAIMGHIAKADGRVSEEEIHAARTSMERLGLSAEQKREAMHLFNEGKTPDFDLNAKIQTLRQCCLPYNDLLRVFMELQFQAAYADGVLSAEERRILKQLCHQLGFSTVDFFTLDTHFRARFSQRRETYRPKPQETIRDAYKILGVSPNISNHALKRAYRKLMSEHHPDKLIAKGLPESLIKIATEKTQEIRAAYEKVSEARGI